MSVFDSSHFEDHEQVVFCRDAASGLKAIIALHDTTLGPALGGCRMWPYAGDDEALADVLRLSLAMTYKHALARTGQGGGKCVVIGDPRRDKSPALFRALGRFVETLGGRYVIAEDVGTSVADMTEVRRETAHVAGLIDPSVLTAFGVFVGIKAAVRHKLGRDGVAGLRVAVQGLGSVGRGLCDHLRAEGAELFVADINPARVQAAVDALGATAVAPDRILGLEVDVVAPCALGGMLNDDTIAALKAPIVAGAANNQLEDERHGEALAVKGVLYAPDYAINAGGIINISFELSNFDERRARERATRIHDTLMEIFARADAEGLPTSTVADRLAMERLAGARLRRG